MEILDFRFWILDWESVCVKDIQFDFGFWILDWESVCVKDIQFDFGFWILDFGLGISLCKRQILREFDGVCTRIRELVEMQHVASVISFKIIDLLRL